MAMWMEPSQAQITPEQVKGSIYALLATIVSVVGGVGSVIAVAKTSHDLLQNRSLLAKRNSELERAGRFADLLGKFSSEQVPKDHQETLSKAVQSCLQQCLANVEKLNLRLAAISLDPNSDLKVFEKLLLSFRPANWRGWTLLLLTYASLFGLGWYVFHSGVSAGKFTKATFVDAWRGSFQYLGLAFLLVVVTCFRAWALEERRRSLGFRKPAGRLARWLIVRFPESGRMLLAQIMFFMSSMVLLTVIHLSIMEAYNGTGGAAVFLTGLGMPLLLFALIFRRWALAELAYRGNKPHLVPWKKALFAGFFKRLRSYGLLRLLSLSAIIWCSISLLVTSIMTIVAPVYGLLLFICCPLPVSVTYALIRSLRIKYSLAEKSTAPAENKLALPAPT